MKFDPEFGELLTAKETSELTGFSMNQLRNWRMPHRRHLAPFGFVAFGQVPYYRKVVVEGWLEIGGPERPKYYPAGADLDYPLG